MAKSLSTLLNKTATLNLLGPDGEKLTNDAGEQITVTVQSQHHTSIKQKAQEVQAYVHMAGKTEDAEVLLKYLRKGEKAAEEIAGIAIVGWSDDEFFEGAFTPDYAKQLVARPEMDWLRMQVNVFLQNNDHFFPSKPSVAKVSPSVDA